MDRETSATKESNRADRFARRDAGTSSVSRVRDPRVLMEIMNALRSLGACRTSELMESLRSRVAGRAVFQSSSGEGGRLRFKPETMRDILGELRRLELAQYQGRKWQLTMAGKSLVSDVSSPYAFALELCRRAESRCDRIISRLLARLWQLNPERQGSVVVPSLDIGTVPEQLDELPLWLETAFVRVITELQKLLPGLGGGPVPAEMTVAALAPLRDRWEFWRRPIRRKRVKEVFQSVLVAWMFGDIVPPRDVAVWQGRMDWAGLTLTARELPGVQGIVWFPVGAFRAEGGESFVPLGELRSEGLAYHLYQPVPETFVQRFCQVLFEVYCRRIELERVEYVSLLAVRDFVCYRLRIGHPFFQTMLQYAFPLAVKGAIDWSIALEVDATPKERNRLRDAMPVEIDRIPRVIIAMRQR